MGKRRPGEGGARRTGGRWRRVLLVAALVLAVTVLLLAISLSLPVEVWRTGELPVPDLPLVAGDSHAGPASRLWVDTDAACGVGDETDVDDCLALSLLLETSAPPVVGVSTVHGNAPLEATDRVVRELVAAAGLGRAAPPVLRGSSAALGEDGQVPSTPAVAALREALEEGPLTIVALGPLTNVAAALEGRPDLLPHLRRLIAVMGRRSGHLFHPSEGEGHGALFGHGPVFTDFNLRKDPEAAARLLGMQTSWTLVPYEAARRVVIGADDLRRMSGAGGARRWTAARSGGWLGFWNDEVGLDGFYPFDLLAGAYALEPALFDCARVRAWVARDLRLWNRLWAPVSLLVGLESERPGDAAAEGEVVYCPGVDPRLEAWLEERLTAPARRDAVPEGL